MGKKKILSIVLASVVLLAVISVAIIAAIIEGGNLQGDNISWSIDEETGTLYINGTGEMKAVYTTIKGDASGSTLYHGAPWTQDAYRNKFTKVVISEGITNVDRYAFLGLDKITEVSVPSTVEEIKSSAFEGSGLESIEIPAAVKSINFAAFADNAALVTVTLNEGLEKIDANAFLDCSALASLEIPSTVTEIGESALAGTSSLTALTVASGNTVYKSEGNVLFSTDGTTLVLAAGGLSGAYSVPEGVTSIANGAFEGNASITGVTFSSVTEIGLSAFKDCTAISAIEIPSTVKTVKAMAFQGCTGIATLTINEGVEKMGKHAFDECDSLVSVTVPSTVEKLEDYLFANCDKLATAVITDGAATIGLRAFNCCTSLTDITLADSITNIYPGAFDGCTTLESITLPKQLITLGDGAFNGCSSLSSISVPEDSVSFSSDERAIYADNGKTLKLYIVSNPSTSYTLLSTTETIGANAFNGAIYLTEIDFSGATALAEIGSMAFKGASSLEEIVFPASVKKLGDGAFVNCTALVSIDFETADASSDTCTFGSGLFKGCSSLKSVTVPEGVRVLAGETFAGCDVLETVELPSTLSSIGANLFYGCSSLKECVLPNAVSSIPDGAFYGCSSLTSFRLPENCTQMGNNTFTGCVNLKTVYIDSWTGWVNYTKINNGEAEWNTTDENGVTTQNANTPFFYAEELYIDGVLTEDIVIPSEGGYNHKNGSTYVPGYLLAGFKGMKTLTIEDGIDYASSYAFAKCTNLEAVYLADSVTSIGARNFLNCTSLKYVDFANIKSVGIYAFEGCTSLVAVDAPNLTKVEGSAFHKCTGLRVINIPKIAQLDKSAFANCTGLLSVTIGPNLTTYDSTAFNKATVTVQLDNQSSQTISLDNTPWYTINSSEDGVESNITVTDDGLWFAANSSGTGYLLGYYGDGDAAEYLYLPKYYNGNTYSVYSGAFANCIFINKVVIPSTVTAVPSGAFTGSTLEEVYASATTATNLDLANKVTSAMTVNPYVPLSISNAALSLGNNFAFDYKIPEQALQNFTDPKIVFELDGDTTEVTDYEVVNGMYVFTFKNIAPHMMNDTITATVVANGVSGYSREYSVAQYCVNSLANQTEKTEFSTLLVDILNYGAATQTYMISEGKEGINATLANAGLTADQLLWGSTETAPAQTNSFKITTSIESPAISWSNAGLILQNSITMRFRFTTEKDVSSLTFKAKYANGKEIELKGVEATGNENEYYLYFKGLNASMMRDVIEFTVYEGDTAISHTFSYSVESYVVSHQDDGDALANLVVAMMNYGIATDAYITN